MPSIQPAEPETQLNMALVASQFDITGSQQIAAHRAVIIAEPYTRQSQVRLLTKIEDLVRAERCKDESMAVLLHELRSPLASIQNAVAVLRIRSKDEALQQRMHELIERQVRQIALLTAGLCQVPQPCPAHLASHLKRLDLCAVLRRAAETLVQEFAERNHQLLVGLPDQPTWVLGDAGRLEQVFVNLLSNASKYSDSGGNILLSMHASDGHAVIQVRDSGIGIAADSMPHIFDLFVRADNAAVQTRPGMGIGLALVRSIVDSHHGTVAAASEGVGMGSEFTVRLKIES